jgi:hypothetical protein
MDLSKFVAMLKDRSLFFTRADKLGDPFEGSTTKLTKEIINNTFSAPHQQSLREAFGRVNTTAVSHVAISCWHENEHESAAMWKLYLSGGEGIAIRSSFNRLTGSLPTWNGETDVRLIYVGAVNYVDYGSTFIDPTNVYWPFVHKRIGFQHEREIRAVMRVNAPFLDGGENVPVDMNVLIESVSVAPTARSWFGEVVRSLVERYGYTFPVHTSRLDEDPIH